MFKDGCRPKPCQDVACRGTSSVPLSAQERAMVTCLVRNKQWYIGFWGGLFGLNFSNSFPELVSGSVDYGLHKYNLAVGNRGAFFTDPNFGT